jgi:VIT1/CCC1 family predicted Fe2+/Mn2+ transporter
VSDFDYLSEGPGPSPEVPYGGDYGPPRPAGRYRAAGPPDYAPAPGNGQRTRGYPPADSGPMPAYRPVNGGRGPGYPRRDSGPMPAYPPVNGGRGPGYPRRDSGPMPAYPPVNGGRGPGGYPPAGGPRPGPPNGTAPYQLPKGVTTLVGPPNGAPVYVMQDAVPAPRLQPWDSGPMPRSAGKQILGWLPFGQRIVLMPKDDDDEEAGEHRDIDGGWLRPAVFGAMDGLVTNASLIAGIGGGGGAVKTIVLTGIAGLIAGAFSMATGEYISVKSQNELTQAEIAIERRQVLRDPAGKQRKLTQLYIERKGVSPNLAEAVVRQISADPDRAVEAHVREELGIDPEDLPSPQVAAVASFASFTVGALIPLAPFLLGVPSLELALVLAGTSAYVGGAAVAKLTGRSTLLGGMRQFAAAFLGTGAAFFVGHLIGGHVG